MNSNRMQHARVASAAAKGRPALEGQATMRRGGFALVAVLACLLVISLVGIGLVQSMLDAHRATRLQHDRVQAQWLAESALDRAATRLAAEEVYKGETWAIAPEDLDGRRGAEVEIAVELDGKEPIADVTATAVLGDGPNRVTTTIRRALRPTTGVESP
jgi:Tfp pilus assembly protein PilX